MILDEEDTTFRERIWSEETGFFACPVSPVWVPEWNKEAPVPVILDLLLIRCGVRSDFLGSSCNVNQ